MSNHPYAEQHGWSDVIAEARKTNRARRARVLAHPDLARRLTEPPLRLSDPAIWSGYVPSAEVPTRSGWRRNDSPIRRQILEICRAVADRESHLALENPQPHAEPPDDDEMPEEPPDQEDTA